MNVPLLSGNADPSQSVQRQRAYAAAAVRSNRPDRAVAKVMNQANRAADAQPFGSLPRRRRAAA